MNEKNLCGLAIGKWERIGVEEYGRKSFIKQKNIYIVYVSNSIPDLASSRLQEISTMTEDMAGQIGFVSENRQGRKNTFGVGPVPSIWRPYTQIRRLDG